MIEQNSKNPIREIQDDNNQIEKIYLTIKNKASSATVFILISKSIETGKNYTLSSAYFE